MSEGEGLLRGKPHVVWSWTDLLMDVGPLTPAVQVEAGAA